TISNRSLTGSPPTGAPPRRSCTPRRYRRGRCPSATATRCDSTQIRVGRCQAGRGRVWWGRRGPAAVVRSRGWQNGGQVEPVEAVGVDDRVDLGDLAVEDGEGHHRDRPLGDGDHDSCGTVDEGRPNQRRGLGEREGLPGHGGGTGEDPRGVAALDAAL